MVKEISKLKYVYNILPPKICEAICAIPETESTRIQEIRMRLGRKLSVTVFSKEYFVCLNGRLMNSPDNGIDIFKEDIETVYQRAFKNSLHSFQREITRGYITAEGGSRIGFCGCAVLNPSKSYAVENIKDISSVNIRIAREVIGCGEDLFDKAFSDGAKGLLIAGVPSSGKTTVLRDLTRLMGNKFRVSLIDERGEISACSEGIPQNQIGIMTDVFTSYNKYEGIMTAVKVMSPQILVCDEIGGKEDLEALEYCINSGVKIVATCHASSMEEAKKRPVISRLLKEKVFDCYAILGTGPMCGKLTSFGKLGGKND